MAFEGDKSSLTVVNASSRLVGTPKWSSISHSLKSNRTQQSNFSRSSVSCCFALSLCPFTRSRKSHFSTTKECQGKGFLSICRRGEDKRPRAHHIASSARCKKEAARRDKKCFCINIALEHFARILGAFSPQHSTVANTCTGFLKVHRFMAHSCRWNEKTIID